MKWLKRVIVLLLVVALVGFGGAWLMGRRSDDAGVYRTANVVRGELVETIAASGVVQAEEVVDGQAQELVAQDAPSIWGVVQQSAWAASPQIRGALHGQGEGVWARHETWLAGE